MVRSDLPAPARKTPGRRSILGFLVALTVISVLTVTFAIAAASLIYSGPLAPYLNRGIGLALLGGIAMPIVVALLGSYRGVVCHLQEVPALLLAIAAASIVSSTGSGDIGFASVATFVGLTSVVTGAILILAGVFRLGLLARFVPYSVIGGLLAATGLLLVLAAIGMMTKGEVSLARLDGLVAPDVLILWLPWMVFGGVIMVATRVSSNPLVLPGLILLGGALFYGLLAALGMDLEAARARGLLLGPFDDSGFLHGLSPRVIQDADWSAILGQTGTMLTIAAMTVLGLLLNVGGIEMATGRDLDPERDLKAVGVANIVAGSTGGIVGHHLLSETTLASRLGVTGPAAGLSVAVSSAVVLFVGVAPVASLPVGLIGAVVAYIGLDFLYEWLWSRRARLPVSDRLVMLLIVVLAGVVDFLVAFTVGLLLATVQFAVSYAGIDVIRLVSSAALRRSSVERGAAQSAQLERDGRRVLIYELSGFLFFGTAHGLLERLKAASASADPPCRIILDFTRVQGLDASATFALSRVARSLEQAGIRLVLSGCRGNVADRIRRGADLPADTVFHATLDDALIEAEADILGADVPDPNAEDTLADLARRYPTLDVSRFATLVRLEPGDVLITQGARSREVFRIVTGALRAEVAGPQGSRQVVARFLPGAIVGEIAYYAETPRTASVLAETATTVLRIDPEVLSASADLAPIGGELHHDAARYLARRLSRMTRLFRDADL